MFTKREQLADELTGFMYKQSDSSDEGSWLIDEKYFPVADQILSYLQSKKLLHPQLQQHDVIRRLPTDEEVKRWFQLLVGKGKEQMMKDIEATFV